MKEEERNEGYMKQNESKETKYCNGHGGWCSFRKQHPKKHLELCLSSKSCKCQRNYIEVEEEREGPGTAEFF